MTAIIYVCTFYPHLWRCVPEITSCDIVFSGFVLLNLQFPILWYLLTFLTFVILGLGSHSWNCVIDTTLCDNFLMEVVLRNLSFLSSIYVYHCLTLCPFTVGHNIVWHSYIYGFWLTILYLQSFLTPAMSAVVPPWTYKLAKNRTLL